MAADRDLGRAEGVGGGGVISPCLGNAPILSTPQGLSAAKPGPERT